MLALEYQSDDGNSYQLGSQNDTYQSAAGDLLPAVTTDPIYPFYWQPRGFSLRAQTMLEGTEIIVRYAIACSTSNPFWIAGPGGSIVIDGVFYQVVDVHGETRTSSGPAS